MSRIETNSKPPSYEILKNSPPGNILRTYLDAARHVQRFQNSVHFTLEDQTLYHHAVAVPVFIWDTTNRFPNLARAVDVPNAILMGAGHDLGELFATHDVALSDPAHHNPTLEGRRKRRESRSFGYITRNQPEPIKTQLTEQYYRYQLNDEEAPDDTTRALVKIADKYTDIRMIRDKAEFYSPESEERWMLSLGIPILRDRAMFMLSTLTDHPEARPEVLELANEEITHLVSGRFKKFSQQANQAINQLEIYSKRTGKFAA